MRDNTQSLRQEIDFEAARDKVLKKLKVGRQSTAGKAIDALIKEINLSGV
ncbi:hypothetical protein VB711_24040 [Cronbergia sp. UHCC 0137]|nr:hypothetical protein [Cronbergia sp. UHCC 0137]MEA5620884.1 hypothetical protein [Cronbergia sp. UHCC 0137]